jgi:CheY-like chemotaxis protein
VILLDIVMPGRSGNETLSALRARGIEIPAIAITGMPDKASTGFTPGQIGTLTSSAR